ncbi:MAG: hypothetical protein EA392_08300 [Cryomorphaceae bacterium]|nr:MAG: hypothetical protein EA392_08300 [Cryomorphaceae bacterium]
MTRIAFSRATLILLVLTSVSGCQKPRESEEIAQNLIWANYEVSYDQSEDITKVKANFRHLTAAGRQLKLSGTSHVRFNDQLLQEFIQPLTNVTDYQLEIPGLIPVGVFTWIDADGKVYNNEITMPWIDFPNELFPIETISVYELFWEGEPLIEDERVQLRVNIDGAGSKTYTVNNTHELSVVIPAGDLAQWTPGFAQLRMERRLRTSLQERTTSGGRITATYLPVQRSVDLE